MGYTTDFEGEFKVTPVLEPRHRSYLQAFNATRRMKRDPAEAETLDDAFRTAVDLPIGPEGAYFVGGQGFHGQDQDSSILDYNEPPRSQPGLWCQWMPSSDGATILWDGGEKFYDYVEWLEYLIEHFLATWGYVLNGTVGWQGEDGPDFGSILVKDNKVLVSHGARNYGPYKEA